MHRIENLYPHYKESVKVEWNVGKRCNYDCSYCPSFIHDNHSPHIDIEVFKSAIDSLVSSTDKKVRISFTGGEPFVHPNIISILEYARPKVSWINVTTNGTRTVEFYTNVMDNLIDHIIFSLHFEYDWEKVLNTIISSYSASNNKNVITHVMMLPGRLKDVKNACRSLLNAEIPFALRPIRWTEEHDVFEDMERYSQEEREYLKSQNHTPPKNTLIDGQLECNVNDLLINKTNSFKNWTCQAGLESLMINWDGEVHRATCRVGGSLGNIYQGTFVPVINPIICSRDWCTCAADINITKVKHG